MLRSPQPNLRTTAARPRWPAVAALLVLLTAPVRAGAEILHFDVSVRGVPVGQFVLSGQEAGDGYAIEARLRTTGLVGVFVDAGYAGTAQGRVDDRTVTPYHARIDDRLGRNRGSARLSWQDGVPSVTALAPSRPPLPSRADPAGLAGSVDPLSALWSLGRLQSGTALCDRTLTVFDGRQASRLTIDPPVDPGNGRITCAGEWRGIAGYDPDDQPGSAPRSFVLTYLPEPSGRARLAAIETQSRYGRAVLRRR